MAAPRYKKLGELLLEARAIDEGQLRNAQAHQRQWGGRLGRILVELKFIDEASLAMALAKQLGLESVRLSEAEIDPAIVQLLPQTLAERHWVFPLRYWEREPGVGELAVAIADPTNLAAADEIRFQTGKKVHLVVALEGEIAQAIRRYYYGEQEPVAPVGEMVENRKEIFAPKGTILSDPGEEDLMELQPLDLDAALTPVPRPGMPLGVPPKGTPLGAFARRPASVPGAAAKPIAPPTPSPSPRPPQAFDLGALADQLAPMISGAAPGGSPLVSGNGSPVNAGTAPPEGGPRESITSELAALTDPGPRTAGEAAPAEVVRPNQLVSALVRILIRKGVLAEAELMEELSRK
jgi:hypothetical protein